jgi:hypothetical protein
MTDPPAPWVACGDWPSTEDAAGGGVGVGSPEDVLTAGGKVAAVAAVAALGFALVGVLITGNAVCVAVAGRRVFVAAGGGRVFVGKARVAVGCTGMRVGVDVGSCSRGVEAGGGSVGAGTGVSVRLGIVPCWAGLSPLPAETQAGEKIRLATTESTRSTTKLPCAIRRDFITHHPMSLNSGIPA